MIFSDEVQIARAKQMPIVALESTIITHGMEYPMNVETANQVEQVIRDNGACPATIAIIQGIIHIGLRKDEIEWLAQNSKDCRKCSKRDLAYALSKKLHGSTTVAATMYLANLAGLKVFVTGVFGGVHRGASQTFDISADLTELARTPVTVVSAGIKSILDVPKTLEVLETLGVPVMSYGTDFVPNFYFASSEVRSPIRVDDPYEVAEIIKSSNDL